MSPPNKATPARRAPRRAGATRPRLRVPTGIAFDERGLVPVVVQERASGDVLMLGWANREALRRTRQTGLLHFWSRSRSRLWRKGETSGHGLRVRELRADCDRDAVLAVVDPEGPACHTGARTCFGDGSATAAGVLEELARVVAERGRRRPRGSYTARLLAGGPQAALNKLGEEAAEVLVAAATESDDRLAEESADLLYHLLVVLARRGLGPSVPLDVLRRRREAR